METRQPAGAGAEGPPGGGDWPTAAFVDTRRVGDATVSVVSDGGFTWAPQLSAPEAEWRRAMPEANARGEVFLGHNMVLIRLPGAAILVDAGLDDPGPDSPWMPPRARRSPGVEQGLARLGVRPEDVTHVVLTHAHGDHIAGATVLRGGERRPRYPRARYLLGRRDWDGNAALDQPDSLVAQHLGTLRRLDRLDLIGAETEVAPGVTLLPSPGDSPGHHAVRVESAGERLYAVGDLFHHACEVQHPAWISPGRDGDASRASRQRLSAAAAAEGATVVFTHEHFPPWGRIVAAPSGAAGYRWQRLP
jgi:glyoxylase-like metal-dependent hydrolase (beta-lactamase superfamily II)